MGLKIYLKEKLRTVTEKHRAAQRKIALVKLSVG